MRWLLFISFGVLCSSTLIAQEAECLEGDCRNGRGVLKVGEMRYEGFFEEGYFNGNGKLILPEGTIYEGVFEKNKLTGAGKIIAKDQVLEGSFDESVLVKGSITYSDGAFLQGTFTYDTINSYLLTGIGVYRSLDFSFEGPFINGVPQGEGKITYSNGDTYEGMVKDGLAHGRGTRYTQKGGKISGFWDNGKFDSGSNSTDYNLINLQETGDGTLKIKTIVNGMEVDMLFDTGASVVLLTEDFLMPMIRNGTLTDEDIISEGESFVDANGDLNRLLVINLKEIKVGNTVLTNIRAAVAEEKGVNLFGMSAIRELGSSISVDYQKGELRFYD